MTATDFHGNFSSSQNATSFDELGDCDVGLGRVETVIFIFLSVTCGVFAAGGNFALLVAQYRTSALSTRVNNYFIVSLAFADFLIGLTMTPLYVCYALAYESLWFVKLEAFLWIVTVTATTYSLSAVSLDRLISVVYPLRYHQVMTEKRCRFAIFCIWFGSFIFGFPRLVIDDFIKLEKLWISCSVTTVAIPLLIMCCCYGKIFKVVHRQSRGTLPDSHLSSAGVSNKKAVVTIGIIVSLFVVTFIPSAVVYFMLLFEDDYCQELILNDVWLWVAFISFTHSSFNPWVYGLRYAELRNSLKQLFLHGNI